MSFFDEKRSEADTETDRAAKCVSVELRIGELRDILHHTEGTGITALRNTKKEDLTKILAERWRKHPYTVVDDIAKAATAVAAHNWTRNGEKVVKLLQREKLLPKDKNAWSRAMENAAASRQPDNTRPLDDLAKKKGQRKKQRKGHGQEKVEGSDGKTNEQRKEIVEAPDTTGSTNEDPCAVNDESAPYKRKTQRFQTEDEGTQGDSKRQRHEQTELIDVSFFEPVLIIDDVWLGTNLCSTFSSH